jgi:hypothetical protein
VDAKTPTRLPAVSFTFHRNWENCPRQAWHVNIARDIAPAETEAMRWGTRVHEALEQHLREGSDLPPELAHHAHLYQFPVGYEIDAELKLGMREDGTYCDFFDSDAWMRGVIDVLLTKPEQPDWAVIIDHKTGKIREDPTELRMHALLLHAYNPQIVNVKGWYNWLRDNVMGRVYDLSDTETTHDELCWVRGKIESAFTLGERAFPPRQSGLCPYCPCHSCEFHP